MPQKPRSNTKTKTDLNEITISILNNAVANGKICVNVITKWWLKMISYYSIGIQFVDKLVTNFVHVLC